MNGRPATHLVDAESLARELDSGDLRVVDATADVTFTADGRRESIRSGRSLFLAGHIPGAVFADLTSELSEPDSPFPFTMPTSDRFAAALGRLGIDNRTRTVVYDSGATLWATRLWWLLRAFGAEEVAVLDGGLRAWRDAGLPLERGDPDPAPARFVATPRQSLIASRAEVQARIGAGDACLLSASRPDIFRGDESTPLPRPGHIPGSVNVPAALFDPETGRFLPLDELERRFAPSGALRSERVIAYCGGGIAATVDAFALALLGREDVAVYDGSLEDWTSDPDLPLEVGEAA